MARPSIKALLEAKVMAYIEKAKTCSPEEMPLSTLAVSLSVGHDRRVLKKYGFDAQIMRAEKERKRRTRSGTDRKKRELQERLDSLQQDQEASKTHEKALLAQIALVEGNAKRLGIDPEELYKPLLPPDRRVSGIFKGKSARAKGRSE